MPDIRNALQVQQRVIFLPLLIFGKTKLNKFAKTQTPAHLAQLNHALKCTRKLQNVRRLLFVQIAVAIL
jgi:hypothetical protein